ncbi:DUF4468 domain-containing protein [Psychroserpens sp.]
MKKITLLLLLVSMFSFSQKKIIFKDSSSVIVERVKTWNGFIVYEDSLGEVVKLKKKKVQFVKDISLSEDKFQYNQMGLTDYVVKRIDSLSQEQLFKKSINWIKENYKNPDKVIKALIDTKKIRFEGFKENVICLTSLGLTTCYGANYSIVISFKDGRYKFDPIQLTYRIPASKHNSGITKDVYFDNGMSFYKDNGLIRNMFSSVPESLEILFNDLNLSLHEYLSKGKAKEEDDDGW